MHLLVVWLQLNAIHAAGSQMPVEKTAAELNSFSQQIVDNETSPDWNLSNGLYDDLTKFYAESSGASSCGSFDDYLEIVNDIELDELDECLARSTAHNSRHECQTATKVDIISLRLVDLVNNETSPDWNFFNGLYDDLIDLSCDDFLDRKRNGAQRVPCTRNCSRV